MMKTFVGEFEQMVMLAVMHLGDEAYGVAVLEEIARRTGRRVSRGALYITLDRLEKKGYLASRMGSPTPGRGGRARRFVKVTKKGLRALRESRTALMSLWRGLESALEKK